MRRSLSVRIAEAHDRKDVAAVPLETLAPLARAAGFVGLSMRASAVTVDSPPERVAAVRTLLDQHGLAVSMVTGDLALATNRGDVGRLLREPEPYFALAEALGCDLLRVMVRDDQEVEQLIQVCDRAAARGLRIAHQTHWNTLFETVDDSLAVVRRVNRPNFGVTFEPSNLMMCGDEHGRGAIERLAPHLFNVYFQNIQLQSGGSVVWSPRRRGPVAAEYVPLRDAGGIDLVAMVAALREVGYRGWLTIHQPLRPGQNVPEAIDEAANALAGLVD